jgi:hypothetical protein
MKKNVVMKIVLLIIVIVLANIYMGCIETRKDMSAEEKIRLKQLELNQQLLMQKLTEEQQKEMEVLKKEVEELKQKQ